MLPDYRCRKAPTQEMPIPVTQTSSSMSTRLKAQTAIVSYCGRHLPDRDRPVHCLHERRVSDPKAPRL